MRRKLLLAILVAAWLVAIAWFVATPYLSVWSLERAAKAADAEGIAAHVDFPALRESLQANAAQSIKDLSSAFRTTHWRRWGRTSRRPSPRT